MKIDMVMKTVLVLKNLICCVLKADLITMKEKQKFLRSNKTTNVAADSKRLLTLHLLLL